jgi:hypothetical protein
MSPFTSSASPVLGRTLTRGRGSAPRRSGRGAVEWTVEAPIRGGSLHCGPTRICPFKRTLTAPTRATYCAAGSGSAAVEPSSGAARAAHRPGDRVVTNKTAASPSPLLCITQYRTTFFSLTSVWTDPTLDSIAKSCRYLHPAEEMQGALFPSLKLLTPICSRRSTVVRNNTFSSV